METAGTTKKINSVKYSNVIQIVPVKYCASKNAKLNEGYIFAFLFLDENKNINGLAEVIENCAAGNVSKVQLMDWFETHKTYLED